MLELIRNKLKTNSFIHNLCKDLINSLNLRKVIRSYEKKLFIKKISSSKKNKLKLIIGSGDQNLKNWISSEWYILDVSKENSWKQFFYANEIDNILAEHVFEHFNKEITNNSLKNIHKYLKKKGCLRIAVPDGYFPKKKYIDWVKPNGTAPGADTHKILYNYKTLLKVLNDNNFKCNLIEYYDENHNFHFDDKFQENGFINRSYKNDYRNQSGTLNYTSIIIDAYKN